MIREGEKEFSIGERGGCCGENRQNQENCAKWEKGKESGRTRALHWGKGKGKWKKELNWIRKKAQQGLKNVVILNMNYF